MSAEAIRLHTSAGAQQEAATPPPAQVPILVDAIEAAKLLSISPRTLWGLTQRGEIPCRRIGRRVLYARSALEEFARK